MTRDHVPAIKAVESVLGNRPHIQTVRRWIKRGVRGIKLDAVFANGNYLTTPERVSEFFAATTQARLAALESQAEPPKPVVSGRVSAAVKEYRKLSKSRK